MQLIKQAQEKNLTALDLSKNQLTELPFEITKLKNLMILDLSQNQLTEIPPELLELKKLTELNLDHNQLTQLPSEFNELKDLTELNLDHNHLTQLPLELKKLNNFTKLSLHYNQLTQLSSEIGEFKKLTILDLSYNHLDRLTPEIAKLKNITKLNLSRNKLTKLPPEIIELGNITELNISDNYLTELPSEIMKLNKLTLLYLSENKLTKLPPEIGKLKNLIDLDLMGNQLTQLPSEITELKNLKKLELSDNQLTRLPFEITKLNKLTALGLFGNPLISPPLEIVSKGLKAIFSYMEQLTTNENNDIENDRIEQKKCFVLSANNRKHFSECLEERLNVKFAEDGIPYTARSWTKEESLRTGSVFLDNVNKPICDSSVLLVEISDLNPNVFFEYGLACAKEKYIILLKNKSKPIENFNLKYISYSDADELSINELINRLSEDFKRLEIDKKLYSEPNIFTEISNLKSHSIKKKVVYVLSFNLEEVVKYKLEEEGYEIILKEELNGIFFNEGVATKLINAKALLVNLFGVQNSVNRYSLYDSQLMFLAGFCYAKGIPIKVFQNNKNFYTDVQECSVHLKSTQLLVDFINKLPL